MFIPWLAVVPVVLTGAALVAMARPPKIAVGLDGSLLRVRLGRWDTLLCLHSDIEIPVGHVAGVAVVARDAVPRHGPRLPGTQVPGLIQAGSYGRGTNRDFWDVRRAHNVLVIELRPKAEFRRLVLQVPDPEATAKALAPVLGAYTGSFPG